MSVAPHKPIVFLEGSRIYLRPIEMADERLYRIWFSDESIRTKLETYWPITETFERKYVENVGADQTGMSFVIVLKKTGQPVGGAGFRFIKWKDRTCEFGIAVGETELQGQGIGTEATLLVLRYCFRTLNLNRVQLGVWDSNERAIRCYERIGFTLEGCQREHGFVDGRYVNHLIYGMLAREFDARYGDDDFRSPPSTSRNPSRSKRRKR